MGFINKYNGSSFVDVPVKKWNGSAWVEPEVKKWDGSKWVVINQQQYTRTWDSTWTQSYGSDNQKRNNERGNKLIQGDSGLDHWGIHRSLCGFGDIKTVLAGAKINDVKLYLRSEHWWYYSGGTAVIGYHNHSSEPSTFSHSKYGAKSQSFDSRGHAQWIDMPNELAEGIRDGSLKGISIYASSESKNYYGVFNGAGDGSYKPKLKITYTK